LPGYKASRRAKTGADLPALRSRAEALRQAAKLGKADQALLDAALAELDGAIEALAAAMPAAQAGSDATEALQAERRLLHAVFHQVPLPMFLLAPDGTIRRANAAAGTLLGSAPGYATGKLLTAFVDLPARAAVQTQLAAAARTGEPRQLQCQILGTEPDGERLLAVQPFTVRGEPTDQLLVAIGDPGNGNAPAIAGTGNGAVRRAPGDQAEALVAAMTRRIDLVTAATRILLENISYSEQVALQRCARLLAGELAAWAIIDIERRSRLRRQIVAGPEDQQSEELGRLIAAISPRPQSAPWQVQETGSSLLLAHADDPNVLGPGPGGLPLLMALGATSVCCVPLSDGERCYGVLTLARQPGDQPFGMADLGLVEELGEQLALAMRLDRMFQHRLEVADALQASLRPRDLRQIPGTQVAAAHVSATDIAEIGGDFYDVYPSAGGWGVAVGDVCGKGSDAAAVTAAARHAIRVLSYREADPAQVLRSTNELMLAEELGGRFVTACVSRLNWRSGVLHLVLSSAGHPAPILVKPDGRTRVLQAGGLPLGIFDDAEPSTEEVRLRSGDTLFYFTDGLTSACGPESGYFEDRLADELAALAKTPPAGIVSRVRDVALEFCRGELRDDMTMLALRAGRQPGS
jgi:serine phosphatase RsbU (regulator of sigma subunit)/PAS domain-containing protein